MVFAPPVSHLHIGVDRVKPLTNPGRLRCFKYVPAHSKIYIPVHVVATLPDRLRRGRDADPRGPTHRRAAVDRRELLRDRVTLTGRDHLWSKYDQPLENGNLNPTTTCTTCTNSPFKSLLFSQYNTCLNSLYPHLLILTHLILRWAVPLKGESHIPRRAGQTPGPPITQRPMSGMSTTPWGRAGSEWAPLAKKIPRPCIARPHSLQGTIDVRILDL